MDVLKNPRWQAHELGLPMPDDPHAVSACLPLWRHNIGYEEGDPAICDALQAAYPRFRFHPLIQELCQRELNSDGLKGLPFASKNSAIRAANYVTAKGGTVNALPIIGQQCGGVIVPEDSFEWLRQYWQHAGENLSSRSAELILNHQTPTCTETTHRINVRQKVASLQAVNTRDVFLVPSGMSAIAAAWRAVQELNPGLTCQFGFPYVDTLKIQQRFPDSTHVFLQLGNEADLEKLEKQCLSKAPVAVFCEVPTNPLLVTPDLIRLRSLADRFNFILVVDDTLGACINLNVARVADLIVTSLTKYFSGYGNVLAGSLVVSSHSKRQEQLRTVIEATFEETLADCDVEVLNCNAADLNVRVSAINRNAVQLVEFLKQQPQVDTVFYPSAASTNYEQMRRPDGGFGGLLSIMLKRPEATTSAFFDNLPVCKGPNLGTNFTLCCPYTILAHYDELEFARNCGVSEWLLRISVGTEPFEVLKSGFQQALDAVGT